MSNKNKGIGGNFTIPDENETEGEPRVAVSKDSDREIERKVLPQGVRNTIRKRSGVVQWETDPLTLKDYSENLLVQSFVDTMAKDVSSVDWTILNGDDTDEEAVEFLQDIHHEDTFSDVIEATVRDLLRTGNAFWVKHRFSNSDELAEVAVPDSATMFKVKDDMGYTEGYVQLQSSQGSASDVIDADDVVQFQWANSTDREYALSPVEMAMDEIDIVDELKLKEMLDLIEGGPSGVLTQETAHDMDPMSTKEWNDTAEEIHSNEGSRHKHVVARGKWNWISTDTSYDELRIIERYKFHLQSIASVFQVNPSYVGFDYENTNRATDESQRESYYEGVSNILEQIEQKINKDLIREEFDTDSEFVWDIETESDTREIDYYEKLADTVLALQEAGVPFELSDDGITIQEGAEVSPQLAEEMIETKVATILAEEDTEDLFNNLRDELDVEDSSDEEALEELSERKRELVQCMGCEGLSEAMQQVEEQHENRTDAIEYVQEQLDGTLSQSTYYNWLEQCGMR